MGAGSGAWAVLGISKGREEVEVASEASSNYLVQVALPDTLSSNARLGEALFNAKCSACHGTNAAGQAGVAPTLVHVIYEPSHHGDSAFLSAVRNGVRAHHWPFGNMPVIEGLTDGDVVMITTYIRELQRANGIF